MSVLFFTAKRRQWTMKETIRRSARKVTNVARAVVTPLTPKKMTFSLEERKQRNEQSLKRANDELLRTKVQATKSEKGKDQASRRQSASSSDRDLEKGLPESAVTVEAKSAEEQLGEKKEKRRPPPNVRIPSSAFEMDSPKTPVWKKVFGR